MKIAASQTDSRVITPNSGRVCCHPKEVRAFVCGSEATSAPHHLQRNLPGQSFPHKHSLRFISSQFYC